MPLRFRCPRCQSPIELHENTAGKEGTCPKCKQEIGIPEFLLPVDSNPPVQALSETILDHPTYKRVVRSPVARVDIPVQPPAVHDATNDRKEAQQKTRHFKFEAMDTTGKEVKDSVDAMNQVEAQQKIRQMGYFVTRLVDEDKPLRDGHLHKAKKTRRLRKGLPRAFPKPYPDLWNYMCPHCQECFQFDRDQLRRPFWWPFTPKIECPYCNARFYEDPDFIVAQPAQGPLPPLGKQKTRRSYLREIVVCLVAAVLTALILTALGLAR